MNKIEKVIWTTDLTVYDDNIDHQHQEIIKIINELIEAEPDNSENERFARILSHLTDFGQLHFKDEENYMSRKSYPGLVDHKKRHADYLYKIAMFNLNYQKTSKAEVLGFLMEWWTNHLKNVDMLLRDFIKGS